MTAFLLLLALTLPAPTELPELRTATSRIFDNHDGTYTARIECSGPAFDAGQDTAPCCYSGFLYGWWDERQGRWIYNWYEPEIEYCKWNTCGLMQFDLTAIPDSARITRASCHWYQYEVLSQNIVTILRHADIDPDTATMEELYDALWYGTQVSQPVSHTYIGWVHHTIDQAGLERIESCLEHDNIVLSIYVTTSLQPGRAYGTGHGGLSPRLEVTYDPSGAVGEEGAPVPQPQLLLAPNPATHRASISYSLPTAALAGLSVLDISGREVWTRRLTGERTGTIQLPLLPAGVYLVRLQSVSFTATEKLVVQR